MRFFTRPLKALLVLLLLGAPLPAQKAPEPIASAQQAPEETVSIQFPHTSVAEVLTLYEKLTGKRIIRDSNLAGPELSIMVSDPVPNREAVGLIESSLLLNGYTLVPVDGKTVKILGPSRPPRSEGLPLYLEESQLPADGDKLVSFYQPLRYLGPDEAIAILQGVVQLNAYGSLVGVPNTSAIVITDKTPVIRKAIALLQVVDCEPKQIVTEFIPQKLKWPHPVHDVQILAPMHKGVAGVGNFNVQLQSALNGRARGLRSVHGEYRPGDKVIQLRNNYDKNLFNGDIGTVTAIDAAAGTLEAEFDGERHPFDRGEFGDLALAYAISIHKSQGSEYPVVVIPLLKGHFMMLQRNLLYTAITRGKKKVLIVGEPAAYAMAVRNSESKQRVTHLQQKVGLISGT